MAQIETTVFISYRRADVYTALAVYENLKNQGYNVFFDYKSISSGDFEQIITSNIRARAHFLLILTPTALDRCNEPGDWLRREIEFAIDEKRNIIPLFFKGFRFGTASATEKLTGKLKNLSRYNGLNVHEDYFDEAMQRLRTQYLNIPLDTVLHPVSTDVQRVVMAEQKAADKALEQIDDVKQLVKQAGKEPAKNQDLPNTVVPHAVRKKPVSPSSQKTIKGIIGLVGGLLVIILCLWSGAKFLSNLPIFSTGTTPDAQSTETHNPPATKTSKPASTITPPPAITASSTPPITLTGKDGMTLLYVPAGEFFMGSPGGNVDELPIHKVYLSAYWIDKTEVTNSMYAKCVDAGTCKAPIYDTSYTRTSYYGNSDFDDYPVIYIDWSMASVYCNWVDRHLPTEAEWEKAARGTNGGTYPWGNAKPNNNLLNTNEEVGDTTKVGSYPDGASPYGALDMAGNVWEWVADWYSETYYASSPESNPPGPTTGQLRVIRGGGWIYDDTARTSARSYGGPTNVISYFTGFRCAMDAE